MSYVSSYVHCVFSTSAFSVSVSQWDGVMEYIETQEEHQRKMSFQEEFIALLKRHRIEYDERYLWE